ncbi:DUF802 domain-containing protein [Variovorax sp. KBW07]|uniref:DUF802 domain-containing protein n=1 Tax=Variovorax sp. KBW07 TaxID=2153358 RepID=UPI000F56CB8A|nr:DUF802 domain-containing protein [Variovorax sp. KBW07]RQO44189.1 DUF802 domain-containing protein [Variovorax sp. KBW07]
MNRFLHYAAFIVGLAAVCWVGIGYIGSNPLALAITLLIGAFYLMGALELHRFHQATTTLSRAVTDMTDMPQAPASLGQWLDQLHPSLRNAVRLRVEGERVGLPGPALTPYLAGLLVLLGMLGTFLGMVVTLNGTGSALEHATDLQAMRASLAAPVKGLGVAFGTSLAGVAASAMLGLVSALCRRDRLQAAQLLDTRIATTLRVFSLAHQREESFRLLQAQGQAMPALVDRLQLLMEAMAQQNHALNERLISSQDSFHGKAEAAYASLATSVDHSLKQSLTEGARIAGATIQPVVEATMAGIARETAALHDTVGHSVQQQLEGLSTRFEASTATVAEIWKSALDGHQRASMALSDDLRGSLGQFAETFEQRSASLVDSVAARLETTVGSVSDNWRDALAQQARASETLSGDTQRALAAASATFAQHSASLLNTVGQAHTELQTEMASRDQQRLAAWTQSLEAMAVSLKQEWQQAGARNENQQQEICKTLADTARDISAQTEAHAKSTIAEIGQLVQAASEAPRAAAEVIAELREKQAGFEQHSVSLLQTVNQAHTDLQAEMASRDQQRLAAWTQSLEAMARSLQQEWQQAGTRSENQQQEICRTLAETARDIAAQTHANAQSTIAEIGQLVQAASEAPRAAAEVIAELRQKLTDSMARDNTMLEERSRILGTLETLLDAVNHASTEQRAAIDSLVAASAELLDRVGTRFTDKVDAETGKMADVAAQITGSAVEVASLGEAFGFAVQLFTESNDKLGAHLQRIEGALGKSIARSDEQLAYYVAQAREVIDLSIMSQKQIVEDLQHIASRRVAVGSEA